MDAASGPPARMVDNREDLTPMLSQYLERCEEYPGSLLLFQNGDFYQCYCEAAETVARVCEVTLTKREDSTGTYPMAGVPVENAASYVERLLDAGYRVAIADQVEDAAEATGLVDRAVTRVVTPGTVVDDELLDSATANYVACVVGEADADRDDRGDAPGASRTDDATDGGIGALGTGDATDGGGDAHGERAGPGGDALLGEGTPPGVEATYALAAVDVSTGDCLVTSTDSWDRLREELARVAPAEVLVAPEVSFDPDAVDAEFAVSEYDPAAFERDAARERLAAYVHRPAATVANDAELRACGALLAYAEYTQGGERLSYVSRVTRYDPREYLQLDSTAIRSLELFDSRSHRAGETLLDVLDEASCALGRRLLARWLRRPLVDRPAIEARHDAVEELVDRPLGREALRAHLREVYDLERLIGRVSRGRANARDLRSLKATLDVVPEVREALATADCGRLEGLRDDLDELADVRELIGRAIRPDPPQEVTEGDVVREGFDDDLDDLRATEREGRAWVADLEEGERERTGIDSLEVGYNQVHGYYIEVTNPNLDRVPEDYQRRQTLKNAERFYTPELKRREDEILGAAERADKLEYELFVEVRSAVADEADRVQALAEALAELDVLASLSTVAAANGYVRPSFHGGEGDDRNGDAAVAPGIEIEVGRHPVVERAQESFVPNDATLSRGEIAVITGPNMSGKSTYMRQVALCVVMAQMGGFVPADAARLPIVDRVFTRVGASDDIAGGQSTFMREMAELTEILHHATDDSLVLLDEVGRGTSTVDGLAIAWATAEFLHDEVGATTLFATHYHDLTALAERRERVSNRHFTADRDGDRVTFLHRVAPGASSSSYGVEVARMAGVPAAVVERSRTLVKEGVPDEESAPGEESPDEGSAPGEESPDEGCAPERYEPDADRRSERAAVDPAAYGGAPVDDHASADGRAPTNGETADGRRSNGGATIDGETTDGRVPGDGTTTDGAADWVADPAVAAVAEEIRALDVAGTTPLEALNTLNELKRRLDD